jgi:hypothetical protein
MLAAEGGPCAHVLFGCSGPGRPEAHPSLRIHSGASTASSEQGQSRHRKSPPSQRRARMLE